MDDLLDLEQRKIAAAWLHRRIQRPLQLAGCFTAATGAVVFTYWFRESIVKIVSLSWAPYVTVSITSAAGANVLYWLLVAPGLIGVMARAGGLNLRWFDPAGTPGICLMSDSMGMTASLLVFGSVAISVLGFVVPQATSARPH